MVARMDEGVGRILSAIERSGETDNTLVLFMSENGGAPGLEPYCNNQPLSGHKLQEMEGGVRVTCAVWWENGGMSGGSKVDEVTAFRKGQANGTNGLSRLRCGIIPFRSFDCLSRNSSL